MFELLNDLEKLIAMLPGCELLGFAVSWVRAVGIVWRELNEPSLIKRIHQLEQLVVTDALWFQELVIQAVESECAVVL